MTDQQAPFRFDPVAADDEPTLQALHALYCRNFPLPEEQESYENFRRCLELNDDDAIQRAYGPYHEYTLAIRRAGDDGLVGGLIFGVASSAAHGHHGYLCSVQGIYLFRERSPALRLFMLAPGGRAMLEGVIENLARQACRQPRFLAATGGLAEGRIAILFEVNNPLRMKPAQLLLDRDLSHVHPALRYRMWLTKDAGPLALDYVQPPLSRGQAPATFLDLFAFRHDAAGRPRLVAAPGRPPGLPGPVLAAHLGSFFRISVLKGEAALIAAAGVAQTCAQLAARPHVPLLAEDDPRLAAIRAAAMEATPIAVEAEYQERLAADPNLRVRLLTALAAKLLPACSRWLGIPVAVLGAVVFTLGWTNIAWHMDEMRRIQDLAGYVLGPLGMAAGVAQLVWQRLRRGRDAATAALVDTLRIRAGWRGWFSASPRLVTLRQILQDRASHAFSYRLVVPAPGLPPDSPAAQRLRQALVSLVAAQAATATAADGGQDAFRRLKQREEKRLAPALRLFAPAVLRGRLAGLPDHAFTSCILPVDPAVLDGGNPYSRLEDVDRWLDPRVAGLLSALRPPDPAALQALDGGVCFYVYLTHAEAVDGDDPIDVAEASAHWFRPARSRAAAPQEPRTLPMEAEAEVAAARMLAVAAHLALLLGPLAGNRQVSTDLHTRVTVLLHVVSPVAIRFMRALGFEEVPRPSAAGEEGAALRGTLLRATLEAGATSFVALLERNPAAAVFFGLISELAEAQQPRRR